MLSGPSFYMMLGMFVSHLGTGTSLRSMFCGPGHYYDLKDNQCKKCSVCPTNQIIENPCSQFADLECGPFNFNDFSDFDPDSEISYPKLNDMYDEDYISREEEASSSKEKSHHKELEGPTTVEKEDREYWKTLAFALIGLLSVLIIVATVVVLLACRKLQKATVTKQPDEGDMDDADSGYVVIRAIRNISDPRPTNANLNFYTREDFDAHPPLLPATPFETEPNTLIDRSAYPYPIPGRLCFLPKVYKPQRRLLTYDADDVFESDDSASSYKVPTKNKLYTIVEKSVSSGSKASDSFDKDNPSV